MSDTINVVRYELSLNDLLTEKLKEAVEAAEDLEGGLHNVAKQLEKITEKEDKADELKKKLKEIGEAAGKIGEAFGVSFDLSKGLDFVKDAGEEYEKLESAQSQVEAGLESTQHAAGLTFDELKEGAEQSAKNIKFSVEQITGMQAVLLAFPAVTKQTFGSVSRAIENMSTKTGQDLNTTAKQVGQALQDPAKGVESLSLNVSDAQQKLIKKMAETGHAAQAQGMIIQEMNREFGGSAAAAAAADPYFKFNKSIEDAKMGIGNLVAKIKEKLAPMLESIAGWVAHVVEWMTKHKAIVEGVAAVIAPLVGVILGVAAAIQTWTVVQKILNLVLIDNPIGIIITAIGAAVGFIIYAYTHFDKFRQIVDGVWNVIKNFGTFLKDVFIGILGGLGEAILGLTTLNPSLIADGLSKAAAAGADIGKMYNEGYNKSIEEKRTKKEEDDAITGFKKYHNGLDPDEWRENELVKKSTGGIKDAPTTPTEPGKKTIEKTTIPGKETAGATGNKSTTINIKINELVKELNLHSTTIQGGARQIKDIITEVLLSAVNDSQRIAYD